MVEGLSLFMYWTFGTTVGRFARAYCHYQKTPLGLLELSVAKCSTYLPVKKQALERMLDQRMA